MVVKSTMANERPTQSSPSKTSFPLPLSQNEEGDAGINVPRADNEQIESDERNHSDSKNAKHDPAHKQEKPLGHHHDDNDSLKTMSLQPPKHRKIDHIHPIIQEEPTGIAPRRKNDLQQSQTNGGTMMARLCRTNGPCKADDDAMCGSSADKNGNTGGRDATKFGFNNAAAAQTTGETARSRRQRRQNLEGDDEDLDDESEEDNSLEAAHEHHAGAYAVAGGHVQQLGKGTLTRAENEQLQEYSRPPDEYVQTVSYIARDTSAPAASNFLAGVESVNTGTVAVGEQDDEEVPIDATVAEAAALPKKMDEEETKSLKWYIIGGVVIVIIAVAVVAGVAVAMEGGSGSAPKPAEDAPAAPPTSSPVALAPESERLVEFRDFLIANSVSSEDQLTDPLSPQYDALKWLADEDSLASTDEPQIAIGRYVLAVFYYSLDGPSWTDGDGWLNARESVCDWNRVTCQGGEIDRIVEKQAVNMRGYVPSELNSLQYLRTLILEQNPIHGLNAPIMNLEWLELNSASLSERYTGIPSEILEMTNLEELHLNKNNLPGTIPAEIGRLSNLITLDLEGNSFTGTLSTQFHSLTALSDVSIADNGLEGNVMEIIQGLSGLRAYFGGDNLLTGSISPAIAEYTNLQRLELPNNKLSGPFPNAVFNISSIGVLDLSFNDITGTISTEIGQAQELQRFILSRTLVGRSLPTEMGMMTNLTSLVFEQGNLEGTIPTEISRCLSLTRLSLGIHFLSGTIPSELGNLVGLNVLHLNDNQLTGPIPSELGLLSSLTELTLSGNQLAGDLPSEICAIPSLTQVILAPATAFGDLTCGGCPKCV